MDLLSRILTSRVRAEIFRLLFGPVQRELHIREIQRRSGLAVGTVRQDLRKLEEIDLVCSRRDGNRLYYCANAEHPLYPELHGLVNKTAGLVDILRKALVSHHVQHAFVFGSVANGTERANSDVDLMVVGATGVRDIAGALSSASEAIGRDVTPYVFTEAEWQSRLARKEHFVTSVMASSKLFVIGSEHELAGMG